MQFPTEKKINIVPLARPIERCCTEIEAQTSLKFDKRDINSLRT